MNRSLLLPERPRILVTRSDRIGDLVLSTPVFKELKKKFPQAWIACLTFCENRDLIQGNPFLDEVILYDKKGSEKGWFGNLIFSRKLAAKKFDLAVHLHATNRMHAVTWLARIPVRIGYDRKAAWALTHPFPDQKNLGLKHEAQYNFDLLKPLGMELPERLETLFPVSENAVRSLEMFLEHHEVPKNLPWIVMNPSASCPSKRWPAEKFGDLARRLSEQQKAAVLVIGTREDRPYVRKIQERSGIRIWDLTGKLSLAMLGVLLSRAKLLISNDSGPVHIADALGTPVVSIFGRKQPGLSPQRWRPLGGRSAVVWKDVGCDVCLAHNCQIHFLCLDAMTPEEVKEAAEKLMEVVPVS